MRHSPGVVLSVLHHVSCWLCAHAALVLVNPCCRFNVTKGEGLPR